MTYFSYITQECERSAQGSSGVEPLRKIAQKIEHDQNVDLLEPVGIFHQKSLGKSYRLFICQVDDQQDHLMILFTVVPKSSDFCNTIQKDHKKHDSILNQVLSTENLDEIWAKKRASPEIPKVPELSEKELEYLYSNFENPESCLILESDEWVNRTDKNKGKFYVRIGELFPLVYDASTRKYEQTILFNETGVGILYRKSTENKILYLIAPVLKNEPNDIQKLRNTYKNELEDSFNQEGILKKSKRAYPDLILDKQDIWIHSIEVSSENANLALSEEEVRILRDQENRYPLFINGRPGSGKSTILQYLFAEHAYSILCGNFDIGFPLYLTYNDDLLAIAKQNVNSILTSNAEKLSGQFTIGDNQAKEYLQHCFVNFRDFLITLSPKKDRFSELKYVGFSKYKELHEEHFKKVPTEKIRKISPELAWHIIRTYIKGTLVEEDEYLDSESFNDLPEKQKSVTQDIFDIVYDHIWLQWYKGLCEKEGFWDDQDLTRSLLASSVDLNAFSKHPVVFCDEAQDFSKNELRLIFRLSLFSNRNLYPDDLLNRIPFAFAGDPFQTINPTGFDWESTQTSFYQTFISQIDKKQNPKLVLNYKELSFNYRSTANIVQLCNFIHLIRGIVFDKKNLIPQTTYFDLEANMPGYFDIKSPIFQTQIKNQEETVIIVPCQEGGELDYVKNDEFLKTFALNEEKTKITRNVLSAMRAKGQGFKRVVIYNFGTECLQEYPKLIQLMDPQSKQQEIPHDESIPLEYFINRLYVAASRAMNRLIIADTTDGLSEFWKFFRDFPLSDFVERYQNQTGRSTEKNETAWTTNNIVKIQEGDQRNWDEEGRDNPAYLGEVFFTKSGRTDSYLLDLASKNFRLAGLLDKAAECDAWRFKANGEFLKSGQQFEKLGDYQNALRMYWKAEAFDNIITFQNSFPEKEAAAFMVHPEDYDQEKSVELLEKLVEEARENRILSDEIWIKVIQTILSQILAKEQESSLKLHEWIKISSLVQEAIKFGLLSTAENKILNELKLRATTYPDQLNILHEINAEPRLIVDYFLKNEGTLINDNQQEIVFSSIRRLKDNFQIIRFLNTYPSVRRYSEQLSTFINEKEQNSNSMIDSLTENLITFLVEQSQWDVVLEFVTNKILQSDNTPLKDFSKYDWNRSLDLLFIKALSVSKSVLHAPVSIKNQVSKYLFSKLIEDASGFYNDLTVKQAGIALERANMIKFCLEFYETIFEKKTWPATEAEISFAKIRWLVCKTRQYDISKDDSTRKRINREIQQKRESWKIKMIPSTQEYPEVDLKEKPKPKPVTSKKPSPTIPDSFPGFKQNERQIIPGFLDRIPPITTTSVASADPGNVETQEDQFEVSVKCGSRNFLCTVHRGHKMTIRNDNAQEMVTILAKKLKLSGSDDEFQDEIEVTDLDHGIVKYFIAPWDLSCKLRQVDDSVLIDLLQGQSDKELITIRIA